MTKETLIAMARRYGNPASLPEKVPPETVSFEEVRPNPRLTYWQIGWTDSNGVRWNAAYSERDLMGGCKYKFFDVGFLPPTSGIEQTYNSVRILDEADIEAAVRELGMRDERTIEGRADAVQGVGPRELTRLANALADTCERVNWASQNTPTNRQITGEKLRGELAILSILRIPWDLKKDENGRYITATAGGVTVPVPVPAIGEDAGQ